MFDLTRAQLREIMPLCQEPHTWAPLLAAAMRRYDITTPRRAAAFIAQAAHESEALNDLEEDLGYSAERLVEVFPKRFPTLAEAEPYAMNPQALAEKVYGNRPDLGNVVAGDGWRYRGRGIFQITGRYNTRLAGKALSLPLEENPDRLSEPAIAALAAAEFWSRRDLNRLADGAATEWAFDQISRRINAGNLGADERRRYWRKAREVLGA